MLLWVILLVAAAVGLYAIIIFNSLVRTRQMANEAWSGSSSPPPSSSVREQFQQCRIVIGCEHERGFCKRRAGFVGFLGVFRRWWRLRRRRRRWRRRLVKPERMVTAACSLARQARDATFHVSANARSSARIPVRGNTCAYAGAGGRGPAKDGDRSVGGGRSRLRGCQGLCHAAPARVDGARRARAPA